MALHRAAATITLVALSLPPAEGQPLLLVRQVGVGQQLAREHGKRARALAQGLQVALVVAFVAATLRLALVVFGLHLGKPLFLALQLSLEDPARVAVAGSLLARVDAGVRTRRCGWSVAACPGDNRRPSSRPALEPPTAA